MLAIYYIAILIIALPTYFLSVWSHRKQIKALEYACYALLYAIVLLLV